ncbi:PIN domain nuclease of toxin-antitoxin system [Dyadobacter sp. BE34]|uniref:PIN domain nuclease of toxin-antitoxin system n=2 Tax=Spirosomataceae TaxID=2896860 RepID=A0ABU1QRM3_9BACT|nr:PIN domain nuclease of toxin-antitoxin system [Dyadobacter fermentans]MDR7041556.1 PIN domain nuclease of toxin-antitoxin system [Dyadobacter sp. BE242]MDR7195959.1 PIN domain nuclease of toxin-antitoxin system [Dyadobacter sp. BE34]MDR7213496.1 PIN domain nuclease of toxin-antitoxin system [Dyadobacter sp. BE31]MDR7261365.1 PIN domain nuclease of toxin-antitoxin system [Dyadobacter sp. BE32]
MTRSILPGFNMDLLLDTHAVVWYITEDSRLPMFLRRQIEDSTNNCYVSIASLWEMGIKHAIGKLALHEELSVVLEAIERSGIKSLLIGTDHILSASRLPLHHNDPFDRMIISQCQAGQLIMVSCDKQFQHYDIPLVWNRSHNC